MGSRAESGVDMLLRTESFEIATRVPARALRPFVRQYQGYVERAPGPVLRTEYPGLRVAVLLELGPPIRVVEPAEFGSAVRGTRHAGGFAAGLHDRPAHTEHEGFQYGVQVDFTPVGARLFFGIPLSELLGRVVSLRDLLPERQRDLAGELEALPDWGRRFERLDRVIAERIDAARRDCRRVAWALEQIEASGGRSRIEPLAREIGASHKQLVREFHDVVGVRPKLAARIVRFEQLTRQLRADGETSWVELAAKLGYSDQSHLVRDVRRFAGTTPTAARAILRQQDIPDVRSVQDPERSAS